MAETTLVDASVKTPACRGFRIRAWQTPSALLLSLGALACSGNLDSSDELSGAETSRPRGPMGSIDEPPRKPSDPTQPGMPTPDPDPNPGTETDPDPDPDSSLDPNLDEVAFSVLGDSDSDEYRADDNRGGAYASVTFNWVEQVVRFRGLRFGQWGSWGGARRSGYAHNWARSGAKAEDLLNQGQAAGAAQQIADGIVTHVFIRIGINNFNPSYATYRQVYDGTLSESGLAQRVDSMVDSMDEALTMLMNESPQGVLIVGLADPGKSPDVARDYPIWDDVDERGRAIGRKRITDAMVEINRRWAALADRDGRAHFLDFDGVASAWLENVDDQGNLVVGGEKISLLRRGNEPRHARLADQSGHSGTVLSGLKANEAFIKPMNQLFDLTIAPFSDEEILSHAGL